MTQKILWMGASAVAPGGIWYFIHIVQLLFQTGGDDAMEEFERRYAILDVLVLTALADGQLSEAELALVEDKLRGYEVNVGSHPRLRWRPGSPMVAIRSVPATKGWWPASRCP